MEEDLFWEYPKLQLNISNKKLKIGQGAYGTVYEETYNNQKIALKKIRTLDEQSVLKIKREINIMEILKDVRQIVQFIGICRSERYVFIAMKLAENKSLFDYIRQEGPDLDWKYAKRFVYDVAVGLSHLHEIHIYHGDIKAECPYRRRIASKVM
jgi:serine/threonine protein kinase